MENLQQQGEGDTQGLSSKARESLVSEIETMLAKRRQEALRRFPLVVTLLGSFGFAALLYSLEGIMDRIGLSGNPILLFFIGLALLTLTGTLYKKL